MSGRGRAAKRKTPERDKVGAVAPDILEPLRTIASLKFKLAQQRSQLEKLDTSDSSLLAELDGHLTRVDRIRDELNEKLRQLLMETAIELTGTQEKLSQSRIDARVTGMNIAEYQESVPGLHWAVTSSTTDVADLPTFL